MDGWLNFKGRLYFDRNSGFSLDSSKVSSSLKLDSAFDRAFREMAALESGAIANPDEGRMVGHYWLRDPARAPTAEIRSEVEQTLEKIKRFTKDVHSGSIAPSQGGKFRHVLLIGIGGSALGPQFVTQALGGAQDPLDVYFFDNTDPDGMERVLACIPDLRATLCVVISKSGGTKETRNGQLVAKEAFKSAGLPFAKHFVAVTGDNSELDKLAKAEGWLERFPMWDWVGGREHRNDVVRIHRAPLTR